jgi:hypothetical protein
MALPVGRPVPPTIFPPPPEVWEELERGPGQEPLRMTYEVRANDMGYFPKVRRATEEFLVRVHYPKAPV